MLENKTAIITGAADPVGIGFAVARLFVEHGARVAIIDLDQRKVDHATKLLQAVAQRPDAALGFSGSICDKERCKEIVAAVTRAWGPIDALVNNAGVVQARKLIDITEQDFDSVIGVNLRGTLLMSQAAIAAMRDGGSVVTIASIAAQRGGGLLGGPHYAASKGGVVSLTKSIAREFGARGIRANSITPGIIMTNMNADAYSADAKEQLLTTIPLNRFGTPRDVAGAALFLASDHSCFITGAVIDVNGGMLIH